VVEGLLSTVGVGSLDVNRPNSTVRIPSYGARIPATLLGSTNLIAW